VRERGRLGITGRPGVGKSTLFSRIVEELRARGCRVGGFMAPEVRSGGRRVGFKVVALDTGEEGFLARADSRGGGPRIGRYTVVVDDVLRVAVAALERALREGDVIGIDEVGPMELVVEELAAMIKRVLTSGKPYVVVYHRRLPSSHPDLYKLIASGACTVEVTEHNRGLLYSAAGDVAGALAYAAGCGDGGRDSTLHTRS